MPDYYIDKTTVVHKDRFAYISHPSITLLKNGEWVAAFNHSRRRETKMHPPDDPLFRTILARTSTDGDFWKQPYFSPNFDWYGTECPGISQLSNGTVILTQFRYSWYPINLAKNHHAMGEKIFLSRPSESWVVEWTERFTEDDWEKSELTWARGYHGLYAHLSTDGGKTFSQTTKINCNPYVDGYSRTGVIELSDGRVAYAVTENHAQSNDTFILSSVDGGQTWDPPALITDSSQGKFEEPDIAEVAPGEIYCILREDSTGFLHDCRSLDGGQSWSIPKRTPMFGLPGHLLILQDGRLFCSYGRRDAPFGIRACLSDDGGRTWQTDREIVIRDDFPNDDLGYPTAIEYEPGKLFVCYYGQEPDGVTCIQGTYLTLTS